MKNRIRWIGAGSAALAATIACGVGLADHHERNDRAAIDRAINGVYGVISGAKGEQRDWDAFRGMFAPNAQLATTVPNEGGTMRLIRMTPDEYVERAGPNLVETGFTETEVHRVMEHYGAVAHAFSTYKGYYEGDDEPKHEGINSIQLVKIDGEWKVLTILWDAKRPGNDIPEQYRGG